MDLHFPLGGEGAATPARSSPLPSFAGLSSLRTRGAKDLWRSVASGGKSDVEKGAFVSMRN